MYSYKNFPHSSNVNTVTCFRAFRYDPRFTMNGPSPGVILSQPAMMGGGRSMFGGGGDSLERRGGGKRGRGYSIDDDLDHLDEMDELIGDGPPGKVGGTLW